jgi:hypothetical protein
MQRSAWILITGVLIGIILTTFFQSHLPKKATAELLAFDRHISAGDAQSAYDALLSAMRVAPDDPKVFAASLDFVRKAATNNDADVTQLAFDIHERSANLIPFLPLSQLVEARAAHTQAGETFSPDSHSENPDDPLAEADNLVTIAMQKTLPTSARMRILQEVDAELGSQATRAASTRTTDQATENFWKQWQLTKDRYEEAQKRVLDALYQEGCASELRAWATKVDELDAETRGLPLDGIHEANQKILDLIVQGQKMSRDLTPYLEGGVEAALKDSAESQADKRLTRLTLLREWNYNRWAQDRVDKVTTSGGSALDRLRSLSVIDEARLVPFTAQNFIKEWEKNFAQCSPDDKLEATKLRILRDHAQ